jgi:hypothetical protein
MAKTKLVALTGHVPSWVRDAFVRCAKEQRRTVSSLVAEILIEDCADDPENPANQSHGATSYVADESVSTVGTVSTPKQKPPPAAPPGPQPDYRPRHMRRPVEEMPVDEET